MRYNSFNAWACGCNVITIPIPQRESPMKPKSCSRPRSRRVNFARAMSRTDRRTQPYSMGPKWNNIPLRQRHREWGNSVKDTALRKNETNIVLILFHTYIALSIHRFGQFDISQTIQRRAGSAFSPNLLGHLKCRSFMRYRRRFTLQLLVCDDRP